MLILWFALTVLCRSGDQLKTGEDVGALMTVNDVVWTQLSLLAYTLSVHTIMLLHYYTPGRGKIVPRNVM